ncbi:MAG: hypothetical protein OEZ02_14725 [Anaerolineae bacterium]|nr:hypothetical protein [Anaerolineae bacterium]
MSDLFDQVTSDQDPFKRIASKIPGFDGYIERQNRRAADKLLREAIADQYTELWKRVGNLQQDFASEGEISYLDDLEKSATKLQTFIDKVQNAAHGYSSFFEAKKVNEEELARLYEFDAALLDLVDGISSAIDNVAASMGSDGLPAAIRHLLGLSRDLVSTFDSRDAAILATE